MSKEIPKILNKILKHFDDETRKLLSVICKSCPEPCYANDFIGLLRYLQGNGCGFRSLVYPAAKYGYLDVVSWCLRQYSYDESERFHIFERAMDGGNLSVMKLVPVFIDLSEFFKIEAQEHCRCHIQGLDPKCDVLFCKPDALEILEWLHDNGHKGLEVFARASVLCANFPVYRWIIETYGLEHICCDGNKNPHVLDFIEQRNVEAMRFIFDRTEDSIDFAVCNRMGSFLSVDEFRSIDTSYILCHECAWLGAVESESGTGFGILNYPDDLGVRPLAVYRYEDSFHGKGPEVPLEKRPLATIWDFYLPCVGMRHGHMDSNLEYNVEKEYVDWIMSRMPIYDSWEAIPTEIMELIKKRTEEYK